MSRRLFAAGLVAAATMLAATPAFAHEGNPNFRSELDGVSPPVPGLEVEVLNYDDSLELVNRTGEAVIVEGYQQEPYVRIEADGQVSVNANSPTYYLNEDRYGNVEPPARADADAAPDWQPVDDTGRYVWHDHRIHYMSTGTPSQVTATSARTKIFDYRVPIEVGDRHVAITGTLFWVGEPGGFPTLPFLILGLVALLSVGPVVIRRRRSAGAGRSADESATEAW